MGAASVGLPNDLEAAAISILDPSFQSKGAQSPRRIGDQPTQPMAFYYLVPTHLTQTYIMMFYAKHGSNDLSPQQKAPMV